MNEDLLSGRVILATRAMLFISSPLGLVLKPNGEFRPIHLLLFPRGSSIKDYIPKEVAKIKYATLENILTRISRADRAAVIIKKDIKDPLQNIPMALH